MTLERPETPSMSATIPDQLNNLLSSGGIALTRSKTGLVYDFQGEGAQATLRYALTGISDALSQEKGVLVPHIESWEYKRIPWWKKAIDGLSEENRKTMVFDPATVLQICADLNEPGESANFFNPDWVVSNKLNVSTLSLMEYMKAIASVRQQIIGMTSRKLTDYRLFFEDNGAVRLEPITDGARQSLLQDNETYQQALIQMRGIIPTLKDTFDKKI